MRRTDALMDLVSQADVCGFLGSVIHAIRMKGFSSSGAPTVLRLFRKNLLEELRTAAAEVRAAEPLAGHVLALQEFRRAQRWRGPGVTRLLDAMIAGDPPRVREWLWAGHGYLQAVQVFAK